MDSESECSEDDDIWISAKDVKDKDSAYAKLRAGAINDDIDLLREALESGAHIDGLWCKEGGDRGVAALHEAAWKGNIGALKFLLSKNAKVDVRLRDGSPWDGTRTPLYCAAENWQATAVRILLDAGASPTHLGPIDDTPLVAVMNGFQPQALKKAHAEGAQYRLDTIKAFVSYGVDLNDMGSSHSWTLIQEAVKTADRNLIKYLMENGASMDAALHAAAHCGDADTIIYLLELGAQDPRGLALQFAGVNNSLDIARALLIRPGGLEAFTKSDALHYAALKGHVDMLRLLLDNGLAVDTENAQGMTALTMLCFEGGANAQAIELLLNRGADINARARGQVMKGCTPLHCAAKWCYDNVVSALLQANADLNATNNNGQTPLHSFAGSLNNGFVPERDGTDRYFEALKVVVGAGADVNAKDTKGNTPLHRLTIYARPSRRDVLVKAVKLLLAHGANYLERNSAGKTFADLIKKSDSGLLAEELERLEIRQ